MGKVAWKSFSKEKNVTVNKRFLKKFANDRNYRKVRDHCNFTGKYRGAAHKLHSICNLRFNVSNEIPAVFHNGSNYDYHFIIKKLADEFKGQFECLKENTEKSNDFPVPIECCHCFLQNTFIESARFMASSLSNLVDNLAEGIYKVKCRDCHCFLEYESVKENLVKYKCLFCKNDYSDKLDEKL